MDEAEVHYIVQNSPFQLQKGLSTPMMRRARSNSPSFCSSPTMANHEKMVKVCLNCEFVFRSELKPNTEFCGKDCETSYCWFRKKPESQTPIMPVIRPDLPRPSSIENLRPATQTTTMNSFAPPPLSKPSNQSTSNLIKPVATPLKKQISINGMLQLNLDAVKLETVSDDRTTVNSCTPTSSPHFMKQLSFETQDNYFDGDDDSIKITRTRSDRSSSTSSTTTDSSDDHQQLSSKAAYHNDMKKSPVTPRKRATEMVSKAKNIVNNFVTFVKTKTPLTPRKPCQDN